MSAGEPGLWGKGWHGHWAVAPSAFAQPLPSHGLLEARPPPSSYQMNRQYGGEELEL